jgi:hypothetical protein
MIVDGRKNKGGRPPKTTDKFYTDTFDEIVKPKFVELIERMMWLALNADTHKVQREAGQYLMDRIMGRPAQEIFETVTQEQTIVFSRDEGRDQAEIEVLKSMTPELLRQRMEERARQEADQRDND